MKTNGVSCSVLLAILGAACGPGAPGEETGAGTEATTTMTAATEDPPTTGASTPTSTPTSTSSPTGVSGTTSEPGETTTDDTTTGEPAGFCAPRPAPARRLTRVQYLNTVRDLFPGVTLPPLGLTPNERYQGFENIAEVNFDSAQELAVFAAAAETVTTAALQQGGPWLPCALDGGEDPKACGHEFLPGFVALMLRRALTTEEEKDLLDQFDGSLQDASFTQALHIPLALRLASDEFLHLRESRGTPVDEQPGVIRLDGFELAARMSYFLWDTMPDAKLHELAAQGQLDTPEGVAEQVAWMQADPRAVAGLTRFVRQWMYLHALEHDEVFPAHLPPELQAPLRADVDGFIAHALHGDQGTLAALLTSPVALLTAATAKIYDVPAPPQDPTQVELDGARRPGLLTRAGWLALRARTTQHSPFQRGYKISDSLFCLQIPPPPPDVTDTPGELPPDATTRELYDTILAEKSCLGCHEPLHLIGYGFETYDLLGAWQDAENGHPVDASGVLMFASDVDGPFVGAAEAISRMAGSRSVHDCVARKTFLYALGRQLTQSDECDLDRLAEGFFASGGRFADLQRDIILSDGFRHRLSR